MTPDANATHRPDAPPSQGAPGPALPPPQGTGTEDEQGSRALNEALQSSLGILKVLMTLVAISVLFSGVFIVEPNEVAIVLRFGKPVGTGTDRVLKPGLHWAFPYPVDEVVRIAAGQSHTISSSTGWYAVSQAQQARGEEPPARGTLTPGADGYLIAADGNVFHARATLKYRIADPLRYAFIYHDSTNVLRSLLNTALLHAASMYTAEAAIYRDKLGFRDAVLAGLSDSLGRLQPGITIDPFDVQVVAPVDVRPAFEAVLAAEQERSQKINEARAYANEVTLKAQGQAQAVVLEGRTAANQLRLAVESEARFFQEQLPHYRNDPRLFRKRWLAETMQKVLTNAQDTFLLPRTPGGSQSQVHLQLNREPTSSTPRPAAPTP